MQRMRRSGSIDDCVSFPLSPADQPADRCTFSCVHSFFVVLGERLLPSSTSRWLSHSFNLVCSRFRTTSMASTHHPMAARSLLAALLFVVTAVTMVPTKASAFHVVSMGDRSTLPHLLHRHSDSPMSVSSRHTTRLRGGATTSAADTPTVLPDFASKQDYLKYMEEVAALPKGFATGTSEGTFLSVEAPAMGDLPIRGTVIHLTEGPTDSWAAVFTSNKVLALTGFAFSKSFLWIAYSRTFVSTAVSRGTRSGWSISCGQWRPIACHCHQQQSFQRMFWW